MDLSNQQGNELGIERYQVIPIGYVKPFRPCFSKYYIYMEKNKRIVPVKSTLDFFTVSELEKFKLNKSFVVDHSFDEFSSFQELGREIRGWFDSASASETQGRPRWIASLTPLPFDVSRFVARAVSKLWRSDSDGVQKLNLTHLIACVEQICDPISPESMVRAKEESVEVYENALVLSTASVLTGLYLGFNHSDFLTQLRQYAFDRSSSSKYGSLTYLVFENLVETASFLRFDANLNLMLSDLVIKNGASRGYRQIVDRIHHVLGAEDG